MKRGRPRLPTSPEAAAALRSAGHSWAQIAHALGVSRSSARRLCQNSKPAIPEAVDSCAESRQ